MGQIKRSRSSEAGELAQLALPRYPSQFPFFHYFNETFVCLNCCFIR